MKVHKSNHLEALIPRLAQVLSMPLASPLAAEQIVVPSQGMQRWIAQGIARHLGIAANLEYPFPARLVRDLYESVLGVTNTRVWEPEQLVWAVMAALARSLDHPTFAPIARYLDGEPASGPRGYELSRRIAQAFDRYITWRPELVMGWSQGQDTHWQAELWRALPLRDLPSGAPHVAELTEAFVARLADPAPLPELPERLSLFGLSSLPPFHLRVLQALDSRVDLHLFLLCPSDQYWGDLRSRRERLRALDQRDDLDPEELHIDVGHPLLGSLGRLGRDFQLLLEQSFDYLEPEPQPFVSPPRDTVLQHLQADIFELRSRRDLAEEPLTIDSADHSIRIHSCHGPMRQVEVLQDQLLQRFAADPTLEPRDVVVMTPDIETYAPLIEAVFELDPDDRRFVPYRIADRSVRGQNPASEALLRVLELARGRAPASQVLELLSLPLVHQRFGLETEDLDTLGEWLASAGVRWGIDEAHRAVHGQPAHRANTWGFGLDRLLLGYARPGEDRHMFQGVLPFDEIEGSDAVLLGRLADFVDTLFRELRTLTSASRPLRQWQADLSRTLDRLIFKTDETQWQHDQVRGALDRLADSALAAGFDTPLELQVVASALAAGLDRNRPARGFLSGQLTFCAMLPMRSIPARIVALLGMDDTAFPRMPQSPGFDLSLQSPRPGDRSPREDDRMLFLEALLSARERLIITYAGQSIRSNEAQPPSVAVAELLDVLDEEYRVETGSLREHMVIRHPLQPFSPRNFQEDAPGGRSFAAESLQGAQRAQQPRQPEPMFFTQELVGAEVARLQLQELERFFAQPVEDLLRNGVGIRLETVDHRVEDREPQVLDGLERYRVARQMLARRVDGDERLPDMLASIRASGQLPAEPAGAVAFWSLCESVEPIAQAVIRLKQGTPFDPVDIDLDIDGVRVVGRIEQIYDAAPLHYDFARFKARDLLRLWIRHLALCAQRPDGGWVSHLVHRESRAPFFTVRTLAPVQDPMPQLVYLLDLFRSGRVRPLLFFPETSWAWADAKLGGGRSYGAALDAWETNWAGIPGEGDKPAIRRVLGHRKPFTSFYQPPGFPVAPDQDFDSLAVKVFGPLFEHLGSLAGSYS